MNNDEKIKKVMGEFIDNVKETNDWATHKMWLIELVKNDSETIKRIDLEMDRFKLEIIEIMHEREKENSERLLGIIQNITKMQVKLSIIMGIIVSLVTLAFSTIIVKIPLELVVEKLKYLF